MVFCLSPASLGFLEGTKLEGDKIMKNMTIKELIKKFDISLHHVEGQIVVPNAKKLTKKQRDFLVAAKPQIMEELKLQEQEKAELKAKKLAEKEQEKQDIVAGLKTIQVRYYDGEILSGFAVGGQEADLLIELGVARYIEGWGCIVDSKAVEILGQEFTYQQAVEYMRPVFEAKEEAQKKFREARQAKFDQARETGEPVLLRSWSEPCCDPKEE